MNSVVRPDVAEFFRRYQNAARERDARNLEECFAETFLNLDPRTAGPVTRSQLIAALPMRDKLFASIGAEGLELAELSEHPLDEHHTLAATTWTARFGADAPDRTPLTLTSHFLLRRVGESWTIVLYLNHANLPMVLAARQPRSADCGFGR